MFVLSSGGSSTGYGSSSANGSSGGNGGRQYWRAYADSAGGEGGGGGGEGGNDGDQSSHTPSQPNQQGYAMNSARSSSADDSTQASRYGGGGGGGGSGNSQHSTRQPHAVSERIQSGKRPSRLRGDANGAGGSDKLSARSQGGSERGSSFTYKLDPRKASVSILDQPPPANSTSTQGQGLGQGSNYRGGVGNNGNGGNMEGIAAWGKRVRDKQGNNKVTTFQVDFPGLSRNQVIALIMLSLQNYS